MMSTEKTTVLWDINGCPIPDGFDPRLVGRRIESALKNSGCCGSGPLTITAIGDLRQTGDEVLRHLSSTGIALRHSYNLNLYLYSQTYRNQKPYTKMLISGLSTLDREATTLHDLANQEYTILLAYPRRDEDRDWLWKSFLRRVTKEWLWKSLLEDETDSGTAHETTRLVIEDTSPFSCGVCTFASHSIDDFATHLKSVYHAYGEWDLVASKNKVNRLEYKPDPPNDDPATVEEWNALYEKDIEGRGSNYTLEFDDFISEDMSKIEISRPKNEAKTLVLWDINGCPIPDGFDPRLVRQRIESALNRSGLYRPHPLIITAIGDLTEIPRQELSSSGIDLKHSAGGERDFQKHLREWAHFLSYPATIMLIAGPTLLEGFAETLYILQDDEDYNLHLAYPQRDEAPDWLWKSFLRGVSREWLWKSLLEGEMDSGTVDDKKETTGLVLQDNFSAKPALNPLKRKAEEEEVDPE